MKKPTSGRTFPTLIGKPFIIGVLGFLPFALTLAVLAYVVVFLHDLVGPGSPFGRILSSLGLNLVACEVIAYGIGLVGTVALIYVFGLLIQSQLGLRTRLVIENGLKHVPLVNTIYDTSKQLTSLFDNTNQEMKAMTPVLCYFGGEGGTAVLGLMPTPRPLQINGREYHMVIIPTAPVPVGGALLCVPVEQVRPAGCSFDGVVSIFMSMGASAPDYLDDRRPSVNSNLDAMAPVAGTAP